MSWIITPSFTQWTPADISTELWLDAADATTLFTTDTGSTLATNGSAVGRWNDKSGNGRNVVQAIAGNRPTYSTSVTNSLNAVLHTGGAKWLNATSLSLESTATIIGVVENATQDSSVSIWKPFFGPTSVNIFVPGPNGYALAKQRSNAAGVGAVIPTASGSGDLVSPYAASAGSYEILAMTNNAAVAALRRNGSELLTLTGVNRTSGWITAYSIGATESGQGSRFFTGYLCELLVLTSPPNLTVTQKLEGYLAHKWGITANLPANHPYKTAVPAP